MKVSDPSTTFFRPVTGWWKLAPVAWAEQVVMSEARQYWTKHLAAIAAEGISSKAYATREGLAVASLYFWRRRLKVEAAGGSAVAAGGRFVAVQVEDVGRRAPCALRLTSDLRLEFQELPAPVWLAALAAAFERVR